MLSQLSVMPLVGWTVAYVVPLPDELKVGIILIGCGLGYTVARPSYGRAPFLLVSADATAHPCALVIPSLPIWGVGPFRRYW